MTNETLLHRVKVGQRLWQRGLLDYHIRSLDAPASTDPDAPTLADVLGGELAVPAAQEAELLARDRRRTLARGWQELDDRQRRIVAERYVHDMTLEEVGDRLNLSRERVRQIEREALGVLRRVAAGESARKPKPETRAPRRRAPEDSLRARAAAVWDALRNPALYPNERERLERELADLQGQIRGAEAGS